MPRAFVLLNARAGNADREALDAALAAGLGSREGWSWHVFERHKGQGRRKACRRAVDEGYDLLVAAGGDGTVGRVADVGAERDVPIGILPVGTGNLVARELGVPLDLAEAVTCLATCEVRRIDAMDIGKRRLLSKVSVGAYAEMAHRVGPDDKRRWGRLAYVGALARELADQPLRRVRLTVDGAVSEVAAMTVLVANCGATGVGDLCWGEGIDPTDGALDVLVITADGWDLAGVVTATLQGATDGSRHVHHLRARQEVSLELDDADAAVRGDGKEVGSGSITVRLRPGAVRCRLPA